jgi:hypothetical protein
MSQAETNADVVCERTYWMMIDGQPRPIPVRWLRPVLDSVSWCCEIQVDWPNQTPQRQKIYGVDSVQAILLAFQAAASILCTTRPSVFLYEFGDDLHLPHPNDIKNAEARSGL